MEASRKLSMRVINVAAAQLGPIQKADGREAVVKRMIALMDEAKARGADLIVYPELALTTFFPRWYMEDQAEVDTWFEREMPNAATRPLFERAAHQCREERGGTREAVVPQPTLRASRRLPELDLGRMRCQGRRRGWPSFNWRQPDRRSGRRDRRRGQDRGGRTAGSPLRSRRHHLRQEHDLQFRAPPPHRALRPDHRPNRRGAASGKLDVRHLLPRT